MEHLETPEKTKATVDGRAFWFYFLKYTENNLPKLERTWLNQFTSIHGRRPILNKADSPIS